MFHLRTVVRFASDLSSSVKVYSCLSIQYPHPKDCFGEVFIFPHPSPFKWLPASAYLLTHFRNDLTSRIWVARHRAKPSAEIISSTHCISYPTCWTDRPSKLSAAFSLNVSRVWQGPSCPPFWLSTEVHAPPIPLPFKQAFKYTDWKNYRKHLIQLK